MQKRKIIIFSIILISALIFNANIIKAEAPSDPFPANGATNVPTNVTLTWKNLCTDFEISLGSCKYFVGLVEKGGSTILSFWYTSKTNSYTPSITVNSNTTYSWKVCKSVNDTCGEESPVWSFTTAKPASVASSTLPFPVSGATSVAMPVVLKWENYCGSDTNCIYAIQYSEVGERKNSSNQCITGTLRDNQTCSKTITPGQCSYGSCSLTEIQTQYDRVKDNITGLWKNVPKNVSVQLPGYCVAACAPKKSIVAALGIWVVVGSLYTAREISVMKYRQKTAERNREFIHIFRKRK